MELHIDDNMKISEVQDQFTSHFPYLKIEFYRSEHQEGEGSVDREKLDTNLSIGEARSKHNEGDLSIHGNQKVSTLEGAFHDTYGLNVQVFRKSGTIWLQTTTTDEWTLSEQNREGEEYAV